MRARQQLRAGPTKKTATRGQVHELATPAIYMRKPDLDHCLPDHDSSLPERLRGVILPEIARIRDLADHTGLPAEWFHAELEAGRLPGLQLHGEWLVHRRALEAWLRTDGARREEAQHAS